MAVEDGGGVGGGGVFGRLGVTEGLGVSCLKKVGCV